MRKKIQGNFNIDIVLDGPGDVSDFRSPPKKSKSSSEASSSSGGLSRGRPSVPYLQKAPESKRHEEASIAKGRHPRALYNAAISRIGKLEPDIAYMNRKFKKYPKLAAESKKWYLKYRKKKGIYLFMYTDKTIFYM